MRQIAEIYEEGCVVLGRFFSAPKPFEDDNDTLEVEYVEHRHEGEGTSLACSIADGSGGASERSEGAVSRQYDAPSPQPGE